MLRMAFAGAIAVCLSNSVGLAGTYEYHPSSVLYLGGTFDPKNLTVSYPSCIRYQREYPIHILDRKKQPEKAPKPPVPAKALGKGKDQGTRTVESPKAASAKLATGSATLEVSDLPNRTSNMGDGGLEDDGDASTPKNIAANNDLSIEQIKTREHLYKFLNISASISGQYKFFSANASMTYESEETFDSDSFVFGVRGMTTYAEVGLIDPGLSEEAKRLVSDRQAFYSRCGKEWVSQETRGVLIAVVYTIKNVSQSQRSKLEAAISGGFGSSVLKINVEASLKQIFESAFVSNYYSAKVHAIGGGGIKDFAETVTKISDPVEVLKKISDYMKNLDYNFSVPLRFTTGSLDQFLIEQRPELLFDAYNRRIADLFLAYEEYRNQRLRLWKFVNDDTQSTWVSSVDVEAWKRLGVLDDTLARIEGKAQVCRKAGEIASEFSIGPRVGGKNSTPNDKSKIDFVQDFSIAISSRLVMKSTSEYAGIFNTVKAAPDPNECDPKDKSVAVDVARSLLCECIRRDDKVYVKERFNLTATPSVSVIHDTETLKPRSLLYVSVTFASKLDYVRLMSNDDQLVRDLKGAVDPNSGPVWYGSVLFRDGNGTPPPADKLPYYVEMKDLNGRVFRKPIVPLN